LDRVEVNNFFDFFPSKAIDYIRNSSLSGSGKYSATIGNCCISTTGAAGSGEGGKAGRFKSGSTAHPTLAI
jgi:hypothetical protein